MTNTPDQYDEDDLDIPAVALTVDTDDGEQEIAVPVRPPADAEKVMDLVAALDDVLADIDPEIQDAVMATLLLSLGNALRQAPHWPLKARLESYGRFIQALIDDTIAHLDDEGPAH